jgi:hypothetical protein
MRVINRLDLLDDDWPFIKITPIRPEKVLSGGVDRLAEIIAKELYFCHKSLMFSLGNKLMRTPLRGASAALRDWRAPQAREFVPNEIECKKRDNDQAWTVVRRARLMQCCECRSTGATNANAHKLGTLPLNHQHWKYTFNG